MSKKINKQIHFDLKNLLSWLNDNKISLNVSKAELMFRSPKHQLGGKLKIKFKGKKLYQAKKVKYLEIHLDKCLTLKHQINDVAVKLSKVNAILSKIRDYVELKL